MVVDIIYLFKKYVPTYIVNYDASAESWCVTTVEGSKTVSLEQYQISW